MRGQDSYSLDFCCWTLVTQGLLFSRLLFSGPMFRTFVLWTFVLQTFVLWTLIPDICSPDIYSPDICSPDPFSGHLFSGHLFSGHLFSRHFFSGPLISILLFSAWKHINCPLYFTHFAKLGWIVQYAILENLLGPYFAKKFEKKNQIDRNFPSLSPVWKSEICSPFAINIFHCGEKTLHCPQCCKWW